ncbi:MAG: GDP-mannose 4,6-dehydratase [Woeseiaceae bacterium]
MLNNIPSALITGISGQDGSYLAELLLTQDYQVIGTTRDIERTKVNLPVPLKDRVKLVEWDFLDQQQIFNIVEDNQLTEIYNFSAYSSGSGMFDDPIGISKVNGLAVTMILEAIRTIDPSIHFCQASSSELFGMVDVSPQSETTSFKPRSPYGAAKLYAHTMIDIYRQRYGLFACSAILYNHESPRRGLDFVTRKITHGAAKIKLGLTKELNLGNLEARRDWGYAADYVRAMFLMTKHIEAGDYVIATGQTKSVRELCETTFNYLGLNYLDYVHEDKSAYRPAESYQLVGNADKAKQVLGWEPEIDFQNLIHMMVAADLQLLSSNT